MHAKQKKIAQNIIVLIATIIASSILYIILSQSVPSNAHEKTLNTIFTKIKIENGSVALSLDVTLDFPSSFNYSLNELQAATSHALRDLNYDEMQDSETINYLEDVIETGIKDAYPEIDEHINVYITDFKTGHLAEMYEDEKSNSGDDRIYKGLFKGMK